MALATRQTRVVGNPAGRGRKLTAKQIRYFGTPRQKAALKRNRNRARRHAPAAAQPKKRKGIPFSRRRPGRNIAAGFYDDDGYFHPIRASFDYDARRAGEGRRRNSGRRNKNPGDILSLAFGNPGGTKGANMAKAKSNRKSSRSTSRRRSRRRSTAHTNNPPRHHSYKHRRRGSASHARRNRGGRRRAHRNPGASRGTIMRNVIFLAAGGLGFFGSKALTQAVMGASNTGLMGYVGNGIATGAMALVAFMFKMRNAAAAILAGGVLQIAMRALIDNTPFGKFTSALGVGDYQMQAFATPQRLRDPLNSAEIEPPAWGSTTAVVSTAAPPGGVHGYSRTGGGLYSGGGLYAT